MIRIIRPKKTKGKTMAIAALLIAAGTLVTGSVLVHAHMTASRPHAVAIEYMDTATATPNIEYMDPRTQLQAAGRALSSVG